MTSQTNKNPEKVEENVNIINVYFRKGIVGSDRAKIKLRTKISNYSEFTVGNTGKVCLLHIPIVFNNV